MNAIDRISRYVAISAGATMIMFMAAAIAGALLGFRINMTESMPFGIWRVAPLHRPLERGMTVLCCLPPAITEMMIKRGFIGIGSCPGRSEPLLKPIVAIPGDVVDVAADGIRVNGELLPNSAALAQDGAGHPLPPLGPGRYETLPGHVWLVSSHSRSSFDARYFGPVPDVLLTAEAHPIWTVP